MPPRRAASCAKTWQPSGYVCLSCRNQFLTRSALLHRQHSNFFTPSFVSNDEGLSKSTQLPSTFSPSPEIDRFQGAPVNNANLAERELARKNGIGNENKEELTHNALPVTRDLVRLVLSKSSGNFVKDGAHGAPTSSLVAYQRSSEGSLTRIHQRGETQGSDENDPPSYPYGMSILDAMLRRESNEPSNGKAIREHSQISLARKSTKPTSSKTADVQLSRKKDGTKKQAKGDMNHADGTAENGNSKIPRKKSTRSPSLKTTKKDKAAKGVDGQETDGLILEKNNESDSPKKGGRRVPRKAKKVTPQARKSTKRKVSGEVATDTFSNAATLSASLENVIATGETPDHKSLWQVMSRLADTQSAQSGSSETASDDVNSGVGGELRTIQPSTLTVAPLNISQPAVPGLEYGLDRVLFNPGVYQLQDPLSRVHNFDPYLQKIMPVAEFDFNALKEYKTSSRDTVLSSLAQEHHKRYIGSTSSMTGTLAHFHFLLSAWRPVNLDMLSRGFSDKLDSFTQINRAPNAMFLRWKSGTYAIDADKEYDGGNVLMLLGKSMEKLLTMPTSEYERYRKSDPRTVSEEERNSPEAYEYTTMGDFLMRSQLDAHDPRLPGTGMFDLKTRAVISVRMDAEDFKPMTGYEIHSLQGRFGSYEREYYDMIRSTMLKYMLQVRMGRMDGIFVAYHNVERIFGFQYIPVQELDRALHSQLDPCLGDQEFKASLELLNRVLDKATAKFPQQSLRLHFETASESVGSGNGTPVMWIFAEPMEEDEIERIQATSKAKIEEFEQTMMGVERVVDDVPEPDASPAVDGSNTKRAATAESSETIPSESLSNVTSSEYVSSDSNADSEFLQSIVSSSSQMKAPLFAASLICKSRINGNDQTRPSFLKPSDVWEVEYFLREWDTLDAMWARYEQMKHRRRELFEKYRGEDEQANGNEESGPVGEITGKQKRDRHFIEFLRGMSAQGRERRSKIDEMEAGRRPVVVGQPLEQREKVDDVGDYMKWLYSAGRR